MPPPFFPAVEFGWAFFGTLVAILLASTWVDLQKMIVPKWLTLPALGLGLAFNIVRGGMLGLESSRVWVLEPDGLLVGACDGALFAAAGFATAFGLFLFMWLLGICGGGDVKLCAAVGAWIGPALIIRLLMVTIVMVGLFMAIQVVAAAFSGGLKPLRAGYRASNEGGSALPGKPAQALAGFFAAIGLGHGGAITLDIPRRIASVARGRADFAERVFAPGFQWGLDAVLMPSGKSHQTLKHAGKDRGGSAAIELMLVLPLLLLIILAMVQIGMLLAAQQQLQLASREGARVAALGGSQTDVDNAVRVVLGQGALAQATIDSVLTDSGGNPLPSGAAVVVMVSVSTKTAVPNFVGWSGVVLAGESISGRTVLRKE